MPKTSNGKIKKILLKQYIWKKKFLFLVQEQ
jgi:hypothetical protein